jgi:hypothetical protein
MDNDSLHALKTMQPNACYYALTITRNTREE